MEANKDQYYIYDLPKSMLDSLELLYFDFETQREVSNDIAQEAPVAATIVKPKVNNKNYYKSDLHRYNLKRSLNNLPLLTETEFDELLEKESIESISGSEDDDDDEQEEVNNHATENGKADDLHEVKLQHLIKKLAIESDTPEAELSISHLNTKSAFVLFKAVNVPSDKALGIYKSMFNENQLLESPLETLKSFTTTEGSKKSALLMVGGGHFAGAIISHTRKPTRGNINRNESKAEQAVNVIASKTFHRYTVRRKQGGSQSAADNAHGKANSAGSTIRRYNEQALIKEIRELLLSWKTHLAECTSIFVRASGHTNRSILIGYENAPLQNSDKRIKNLPFTTKRATASELKRAWVELSYLKQLDLPKVKAVNRSPTPNSDSICTKKIVPERSENDKHSEQLISLLKRQKSPKLITYIKQNNLDVNQFRLSPQLNYAQYPTLLHYASSHNLSHMIQILLLNLKADPTILNEFGKTAVEICDSSSRKVFQVARYKLGEDAWDWSASKVGAPKSQEEVDRENKEELDRVKKEKQQQLQEVLNQKSEMELKTPKIQASGTLGGTPMKVINEMNGLSDEQKQRIMREQRARAAEARLRKPQ